MWGISEKPLMPFRRQEHRFDRQSGFHESQDNFFSFCDKNPPPEMIDRLTHGAIRRQFGIIKRFYRDNTVCWMHAERYYFAERETTNRSRG
jgi:predicted GNAT superfamily acetyltransferase